MRALFSIVLSSLFAVSSCAAVEEESKVVKSAEGATPEFYIGPGLSEEEQKALKFFQQQGITDRAALATILGNIKQESKFHPNICEGGARVKYPSCHRGGYGLIQWTTSFRYWGLGDHAKLNQCDPSMLECQLDYLVTEREWKSALKYFKNEGQSIDYYMKGAYIWLGWGVYGARGTYAYQYYDFITISA